MSAEVTCPWPWEVPSTPARAVGICRACGRPKLQRGACSRCAKESVPEGIAARNTPLPVRSTVSPSGWMLVIGQRNRMIKALDAAASNSEKLIPATAQSGDHRIATLDGHAAHLGFQPA